MKNTVEIEVLLGRTWSVVTLVSLTGGGSVFWKSPAFTGNCPRGYWRYR